MASPVLTLGATLHVTGETARIIFNEVEPWAEGGVDGDASPMEMMARDGHLHLSGVLVVDDVVTMDGASFNAIVSRLATLSATAAGQNDLVVAQRARLASEASDATRHASIEPN